MLLLLLKVPKIGRAMSKVVTSLDHSIRWLTAESVEWPPLKSIVPFELTLSNTKVLSAAINLWWLIHTCVIAQWVMNIYEQALSHGRMGVCHPLAAPSFSLGKINVLAYNTSFSSRGWIYISFRPHLLYEATSFIHHPVKNIHVLLSHEKGSEYAWTQWCS